MTRLVAADVAKSYPTRAERLEVLRGVSLELESNQSLAIVGPSGSGKSTLLHVLGTLERPTAGQVRLDQIDPFALDDDRLADFRNRQIGFVFQDHHLLPQCNVLENVLLPTLAGGGPSADERDRARHLLDRVGLAARLAHRPAELSGGERQRAALARALIRTPRLLLADEPTGNLDRTTAAAIVELLLEQQRHEALILIVVTHSPEVARRMERQCELDAGQLHPCENPAA